ncbi:Golgi-associated kinase 1A-like [Glandiceps talaboti]
MFWKLDKVKLSVVFVTVVLVFASLQKSLPTLNLGTTRPVPSLCTHPGEKCLPIPKDALRNISAEPVFVVIKPIDVGEMPPIDLFIEDREFLEDIKKLEDSDLRLGQYLPNWFSYSDILKMELMSHHNISDVLSIPGHPRVRRVIFKDHPMKDISHFEDCTTQCAVQKSVKDIHEVFSFHLDRVLGINRSMPAVTRTFKGERGGTFSDGKARAIIWWNPNIKHSGSLEPEQNSMSLRWTDYQNQLALRCYAKDNMKESAIHDNCTVKVRHIEWGRLAFYDFLLQNHDRSDRNCCGYDIDEGELCFKNGNYLRCKNITRQYLIHIFTTKYDDTRLVYIDNVFNLNRNNEHLNYRFLEGIDEIPEYPISVLKSGKFRELMLQSLYLDKIYWQDQGGLPFMDKLIDIIEKRAQKLITCIEERGISLVRDY